jgi:hypothetical protein
VIISHEHHLIFLKTRKTAGTSVEIALSDVAGPQDVITAIDPADEEIRRGRGGRGPQNDRLPLRAYGAKKAVKRLLGRGNRAYNHMPASEVRRMVGAEVWDSYLTFSIERNPWDAVISQYHWRHRSVPREQWPSLAEYLTTRPVRLLARNVDIYSLSGVTAVDHLCRFESLDEDLDHVRRAAGLADVLELPRAKGESRTDRRPYREFYSDADRDTVARMFARTIAATGYRF